MQSGMHTKCIQTAYKVHTSKYEHIKSKKREFLFYFFLYCLFFYLPLPASSGIPQRIMNDLLPPVFADDGLFSGFHRPSDGPSAIIPTHFLTYGHHAFCGRARIFPSASSLGWTIEKLYVLYASKTRLCTLCEDTTPELTAYKVHTSI